MKNFTCRLILGLSFITQSYAVDSSLFKLSDMTDPVSFTVSIKNVGQGSCTIIRNHENNHFMIIDAGSLSDKPYNTEERILEEFGFSEVNEDIPLSKGTITVVVSHSDKDHINLLKTVFGSNQLLLNRISRIYAGDHFENYFRIPETREFLKDFVKKIPDVGSKIISLSHDLTGLNIENHLNDTQYVLDRSKYYSFRSHVKGDGFLTERQLTLTKSVFEIIGANAGAKEAGDASEKDTNINSAVVRLSIAGNNILIMGDATGDTTDKILEDISNPESLKTILLVAGHHGADTDNTNHITWAAVTEPQHVALSTGFNKGYKHPTLTAVANYLVTGLKNNRIYSAFLFGKQFHQTDVHEISIFNGIGQHIKTLKPNIAGLEFVKLDQGHEGWGIFKTEKPIYSTGSSGELRYVFSDQGKIVNFWRER